MGLQYLSFIDDSGDHNNQYTLHLFSWFCKHTWHKLKNSLFCSSNPHSSQITYSTFHKLKQVLIWSQSDQMNKFAALEKLRKSKGYWMHFSQDNTKLFNIGVSTADTLRRFYSVQWHSHFCCYFYGVIVKHSENEIEECWKTLFLFKWVGLNLWPVNSTPHKHFCNALGNL